MPLIEVITLLFVGLASGILGGLLGIGGSIIIIPVLTLFIRIEGELINQHIAQAAAMIVNFFVAVPATLRHHRERAVDWRAGWRMLPFGVAFIVIGVVVSHFFDGRLLMGIFAVFLFYIVLTNALKLMSRDAAMGESEKPKDGWIRVGGIGSIVGFMAGLLGIGGGTLMVPLLQRIAHFPLRRSIATSSAVMCITAAFGAVSKNLSVIQLDEPAINVNHSLLIAACLAPTAFIGGTIGARLTHALPIKWVRLVFVILLAIASVRMLWSAYSG